MMAPAPYFLHLSVIRLLAASLAMLVLCGPASAQLTTTPGPGGVPIAPGAPLGNYTPGGKSFGGVEIAPGAAARDVPMYRQGPGEVPVLVVPEKRRGKKESALRPEPGCNDGASCLPQNLQLTIKSREHELAKAPAPDATITSIRELFAALDACWEPPADGQADEGMQMSVRFSFRRTGKLFATPFVTYSTRGVAAETRQTFRKAIDAALERCGKLTFSKRFGTAIAGRPISVRFVDDRASKAGER